MRLIFFLLLLISNQVFAQDLPLNLLHLPPGFSISIYASPVPSAREMTLGSKDIVFVGSNTAGSVYAIVPDAKRPGITRVITIAKNLNTPNGVAFLNGNLYVAEIGRILRYDDIENHLSDPPKPVVVSENLPKELHHGMRFSRFGPDGKLYIGVGMPCNVCKPKDPRFGTIMRMDPDGSHVEIYAKGIRNTVGFDWDPRTQKLWFTDNGRDYLGDESPPDKISVASQPGLDFGFPYYNGQNLPDPEFGKLRPSYSGITPPAFNLPAHVAALGMSFYTGNRFPSHYKNQIFIAEHGSWNRSKKIGYQVVTAELSGNRVTNVKPFITGWLQGQTVWGRPVATLVMPDGALLVSDDYASVVYRVTYKK